jgi:hypothetical protein
MLIQQLHGVARIGNVQPLRPRAPWPGAEGVDA